MPAIVGCYLTTYNTRALHHVLVQCAAAGSEGQLPLATIAHHGIEIEPERCQDGLRHRANLLAHIVLAIRRVLNIVERLGAGGGHEVLDDLATADRGAGL